MAECQVWDAKRDLALLKIVAIESEVGQEGMVPVFKSIPSNSKVLGIKMSILCIGQPGRDDLESAPGSNKKTKYNLMEISEGTYKGLVKGADPQDCSDIGSLMHDAWTYWGHSGAPLVKVSDGTLVGLHSSCDEETGIRHGVPAVAIAEFLERQLSADMIAVMGLAGVEADIS